LRCVIVYTLCACRVIATYTTLLWARLTVLIARKSIIIIIGWARTVWYGTQFRCIVVYT
jgi:hypothetical protein